MLDGKMVSQDLKKTLDNVVDKLILTGVMPLETLAGTSKLKPGNYFRISHQFVQLVPPGCLTY